MSDPELKAMSDVLAILEALPEDATRMRVVEWVLSRLGLTNLPQMPSSQPDQNAQIDLSLFETVADVFSKAQLENDSDRALIVAAYLQEHDEIPEFTGYSINKELKNLGHGVLNITDVLSTLIERKPQLVIQTRKSGKTKQAKKKYRVTDAGIAAATALLQDKEE